DVNTVPTAMLQAKHFAIWRFLLNKTKTMPKQPIRIHSSRKAFEGAQTPFAQNVYSIVSKIPAGKTLTYQAVAQKAGRPSAYRAVGSILGKNRDMRVPCHRVVRSDGGMGGYAFGG